MRIITIKNSDFNQIRELINDETTHAPEICEAVTSIIKAVKKGGNKNLLEYTNKFDRNKFKISDIKVSEQEIEKAYKATPKNLLDALQMAAKRVESYYKPQLPRNLDYKDKHGVRLGVRWQALDSAGLYVPGGTASYPSSVIMNAIPAKVAGVKRIVMVCPAMDGKISNTVLAAAKICGITEIYKIGGAQSIAALAYGTETIKPVDKIVGPGNAYVAEAKRQVFGKVGIDMIAGPSEILVIADAKNDPDWLAADLLSQAEHDVMARAILITDSKKLAEDIKNSVQKFLKKLSRKAIAEKSINERGVIILVKNLSQGAEISNLLAPEHLELAVENPNALLKKITNAGAVFLGRYTPEAIGDYIAGPSHVLPTTQSCRFSSGLSVYDFLRRQSLIGCDKKSFSKLAAATELLANSEGLTAHALSISVRK